MSQSPTALPEAKMTREDALQEARRRWGKLASVYHRDHRFPRDARCFVQSARWANVGIGATWEAAFLDADRREK